MKIVIYRPFELEAIININNHLDTKLKKAALEVYLADAIDYLGAKDCIVEIDFDSEYPCSSSPGTHELIKTKLLSKVKD